jgi:threonine dehydrogenase-like Zn-dependent dehydrogenase
VTAQAALVAGAAEVVVTDVNAARLAAAGRIDGVRPVDVTATPVAEAVARSTRSSSARARAASSRRGSASSGPGDRRGVGMAADDEVSLRLSLVQDNELTLTACSATRGSTPRPSRSWPRVVSIWPR